MLCNVTGTRYFPVLFFFKIKCGKMWQCVYCDVTINDRHCIQVSLGSIFFSFYFYFFFGGGGVCTKKIHRPSTRQYHIHR